MSTLSFARSAWRGLELSALTLALCIGLAAARGPGLDAPVRRVSAPAPAETLPAPGPLELRTLVLHPDVEESFPARSCNSDGLPAGNADCDAPPLMT